MMRNSVLTPWLPNWQPKAQARVRLFCFPHAGGGASLFRSWSAHLAPHIEVCPVQLPGRESRLTEKPFSQIAPLVQTLTEILRPYLDKPFAFFGHSMGSLISFELAQSFEQEGLVPIHLFAASHRAPQLPDPDPPTYHLPQDAFIEEVRRLKGTPEEILQNTELLQILLPLLRADFELCETYQYTPASPLSCPITAYGGLLDQEVPREMLAAWDKQTSSTFKYRFFPGGHFFWLKEPESLLNAIALDLLPYISS